MRILFLTHSFNSLAQRLYLELSARKHEVSIEFDINDAVAIDAVERFNPELIVAPFLKRAIPEQIWRNHVCFVVHPGVPGDRGPSSLDWAIMNGESEWGVTILQANAEMDGGDIWAEETFPMRFAPKSSIYRNEVTDAAVRSVLQAVERFQSRSFMPRPQTMGEEGRGKTRPLMAQLDRAIDWSRDSTLTVLRKIYSADGSPGVLDSFLEGSYFLFDAHACFEDVFGRFLTAKSGDVVAICGTRIIRKTVDGAVTIGHLKRKREIGAEETALKLPATVTLGAAVHGLPEVPADSACDEIRFERNGEIGFLHFGFYNGAMSTDQCVRLNEAVKRALGENIRVLVLFGGEEFWSNGIHLHMIEAASSPADESWRNIQAMNDLVRTIVTATNVVTVSAIRGNAGAGGVFLALGADHVFAREDLVLNPHYKAMGNLYGSEYWTYLLPRRVGEAGARAVTEGRLPISSIQAKRLGLIDDCFAHSNAEFRNEVQARAKKMAAEPEFSRLITEKKKKREDDEKIKPLETYRTEELEQMKLNFYGFDPSYHIARYNFVRRIPHSRTPRHLAVHKRLTPRPERIT